MSRPRTFTKIFYLDQIFNRSSEGSTHWVGTTLKAYRVLETNNNNFQLDIVADPTSGSIQGIPVGEVRLHNYSTIANNAVMENSVAQPDVWVRILFSVEDELVWTGEKESGGSEVLVSGGSTFTNDKAEVSTAGILLLGADDNRASSDIYNQTAESFYVGASAKILAADFEDTCIKVRPGESFRWDLPDALHARSTGAGSIYPVVLTKAKA